LIFITAIRGPIPENKPKAAWATHTFSQLLTEVYNHTFEVLDTLKSIGVTPEWAQIGNEIVGGMLWPDGKTSNWSQLAQLLNKGYDATKAVDNAIKVILHIDQGNNNSRFRTFFDNAKNYNVSYDIIGASYYPYWLGTDYTVTIDALGNNLNDMVSRYGKDVMVVEVGGDYTLVQNTYDMLVAVIKKVSAVPNHKGLGVIYWEPEGAKSWSGYQLSAWGSDGRPTAAMNAFLIDPSLGVEIVPVKPEVAIYPNPSFDGILKIELKDFMGKTDVKVIDMKGEIVKEQTFFNQPVCLLDVSLLHGLYIINVINKSQVINQKIAIN